MGNKLGTPAPIPVTKQHSRSKGVHIYVISTRAVANEMAVDILGPWAANSLSHRGWLVPSLSSNNLTLVEKKKTSSPLQLLHRTPHRPTIKNSQQTFNMSRSRAPLALGLTAAGGIGYYVRALILPSIVGKPPKTNSPSLP